MSDSHSDIASAWVVAAALIAFIGLGSVHSGGAAPDTRVAGDVGTPRVQPAPRDVASVAPHREAPLLDLDEDRMIAEIIGLLDVQPAAGPATPADLFQTPSR